MALDSHNDIRKGLCERECDEFVGLLLRRKRDGVGDDELVYDRGVESLHGGIAEDRMRTRRKDALCSALLECLCALAERTCRIDNVIDEERRLALNLTNEVHDLCAARARTTLLDDCDRRMEEVRHDARTRNAAEIRRDNNQILNRLLAEVARKHGSRCEVIDGNIKESLNLTRMEVDRHNAGHTRRRHEIGDEFCRDWLASARLAILTRIGVVRDNRRNAVCRRAFARIREDQQLHEVVIDGKARRLDDEDVLPANALLDHHLNLAVVELPDESLAERYADTFRNILCQLWIGIPRQDAHVVGRKTHLYVPPKNQMRHYK